MIEIGQASWQDVWPEIEPLLAAHRDEVEPDADRPFDVASEIAKLMDRAGQLSIHRALDGHLLVGYIIWYLTPCLDSAGVTIASMGPWYVRPSHRRTTTGLRLWNQSIEHLKGLGIRWTLPHLYSASPDAQAISNFYLKKGARPLETTFFLDLGAN